MPMLKPFIFLASANSTKLHGKSCLPCLKHNPPDGLCIPNLTFRKDHTDFVICNHASGVHTDAIPLQNNKRRLVWFIVGFAFGDEHLLGYDLTMKHSGSNIITAISVNGREYTIISRLFELSAMRGHTIQCWHVCSEDGTEYIIKDSWINSRQPNKFEILGNLLDVENVSTLVEG